MTIPATDDPAASKAAASSSAARAATPSDGLAIVTELARRFAAGDGTGAAALLHPQIRIQQPASLPHEIGRAHV